MKDKSLEAQRKVLIQWLQKTLGAQVGEEYYLHVHARDEQKKLLKAFKDEIKILEKIDPIGASQLYVFPRYQDKRFWVGIRKVAVDLTVGFKKTADGSVIKETLEDNSDVLRRLSLMREDGMTWQEIEEMEGGIQPSLKEAVDG